MIIRSVRISSFGKYRDWSMPDIPGGLTLITGGNESGKTTLMEFMRSTLFPSSRRPYPLPSKTDAGSMEIEMSSGERFTLVREQRKVTEISGRALPQDLVPIDAETYRSVFAMDLSDLANDDAISSERIRNRFLTIPGGERVPDILRAIASEKAVLMNEERITDKNAIGAIRSSLTSLDMKIAELGGHGDYDGYEEEMRSAGIKLAELTETQNAADGERIRRSAIASQAPNLERRRELMIRRDGLEYSRSLSGEDASRYAAVSGMIRELDIGLSSYTEEDLMSREIMDGISEAYSDLKSFAGGYEKTADRIEVLKDMIAEDEESLERLNISPELAAREKRDDIIERSKRGMPFIPLILAAAGAALIPASAFTSMHLAAAGAVLLAAGIAFYAKTGKNGRFEDWMESRGYPRIGRDRAGSFVMKLESVYETSERIACSRYEMEVISQDAEKIKERANDAAMLLGMRPNASFREVLGETERVMEEERAKIRRRSEAAGKREERERLSNELEDMVKPYGGTERFEKAVSDRAELNAADSSILEMETYIMSSIGMTAEEAEAVLAEDPAIPDVRDLISGTNVRIGELKEKMDRVLNDGDAAKLRNERNAVWSELAAKIREWGVVSLEESIINRSCSELYGKMQPSVIGTANGYLGTMTDGRYTLDPDPRLEETVVTDTASHKTSRQWSSGLGDQIYLAIKMAVAKELCSERMPMILDDVLVRFDPERRKRACGAILEFAKGQQVFLFSCDTSIESSFPADAEMNVIRL